MRTSFDCIPCFVRQALEAVRFVTDEKVIHEQVLRKVLQAAAGMDFTMSPPVMGQRIHRLIRTLTGQEDPYLQSKVQFNKLALQLYPELKTCVENAGDPMETAVRLAIAGNIIDCGVYGSLDASDVGDAIEHALQDPVIGSLDVFYDAIASARSILYLADNAGEIVFDRLLIEQMPLEKTTLVVKGSPVINDATLADAESTGLKDLVEVIDNGSDAPGTVLEECSESFRRRFDDADLVIAKGQGNYETLSDIEKNIFFALKVKCPVIAEHLGCQVGSLVLQAGTTPVLSASSTARLQS